MTLRIESRPRGFGLDVKRLYLPGAEVYATCPQCGVETLQIDLADDYLEDWPANEETEFDCCCRTALGGCGHEWDEPAMLAIELRALVATP